MNKNNWLLQTILCACNLSTYNICNKKVTILNQKVILRAMDYRGIYATGRESLYVHTVY